MKGKNEMTASFPSLSQNEALARSVVAVFVSQLNPTVSELSDLRTAVSEAVTNAIVHGYRGTVGTVYITVRQVEEHVIQVKIRDKGVGIADIEKAMEPLYTTAPEEERACVAIMDACLLRLAEEKENELLAALMSGDQKTFELFRCEAPELQHLPDATYDWYCRNYLDRYYPVRIMMKLHGIHFPVWKG